MKRLTAWYLLFFILITYLLINTGLVSDDLIYVHVLKDRNFTMLLLPGEGWQTCPVENYTHRIWYHFFSVDNTALADILKIIYIILAFYMTTRFFSIFLNKPDAFLASFIFIFFPSHDTTVYWFLAQYLTLSMAFYLYAFYLAHHNRLFPAFLVATLASFISYGSPAIALSLFVIFALNKEFKKGAALLIPNIIYSMYYIYLTKVMSAGVARIPEQISVFTIGKQFVFQAVTFIDAVIGPSMWLKVYYSFHQLSFMSIMVGIILTACLYSLLKENRRRYDPKLIIGFTVMMISSFVMFAVTGKYPQLAFNVGDRVTIFGSLLITYLIILAPVSNRIKMLAYFVLIFSILGISDHWKMTHDRLQVIYSNIKNNKDLVNYGDRRAIYVSGNQYSKFGKISHIELMSDESVGCLFSMLLGKEVTAMPFNKNYRYEDGDIADTKSGERYRVDGYINVYDSTKNILFKLYARDINSYIDSLPRDSRHWSQAFDIGFIKQLAAKMMPRLKYAL